MLKKTLYKFKRYRLLNSAGKELKLKKSLLTRWILIGCTFLIIPLILLAICMNYSVKQLEKSQIQQTTLSLINIQGKLDTFMSDQRKISNLILSNDNFSAVNLSYPVIADRDTMIDNYEKCMRDLFSYSTSFADVDILCYFPETHYIVTPKTCNTIDTLANTVTSNTGLSITGAYWGQTLTKKFPKIVSARNLSYTNFGTDSFVYTLNKVDSQTGKTIYTIFFSIPKSKIYTEDTFPKGASLLLTEKDGTLVSTLVGDISSSQIPVKNKTSKQHVNNKNYFSIVNYTSVYNGYYVLFTPYNSYFQNIMIGKYVSIILIIVILVIGIRSVILIQRRTFRPIQNMVDNIRSQYSDMNSDNELLMINEFITRLKNENKRMRSSNHDMKQYAQEITLHKLLTEDEPGVSCEQLINQINENNSHMTLISINAETIGTSFENQTGLLLWSINNVLSELFEEPFHVMHYKDEYSLHYMIYYDPDDKIDHNTVLDKANYLYDFFREKFFVNLSITLSSEFEDPLDARQIHQDIDDIVTYRMLIHSYGVNTQNDVVSEKYNFIQTASKYRQKFHNVLIKNDSDKISQLCNELFHMYETSGQDQHLCKYHLLNIVNPLLFAAQEYENKLYENAERYIVTLCQCTTLKDLHSNLLTIMNSLVSHQEYIMQEKNDYIIDEVKAYINEHYTDEQLNVCSLSEHVQLSPKYLGTLYRKTTGEGIPQYINRIRIEKAIDLLMDSHYTFDEIATMVGFGNTRSFRRNFKQLKGMNPNEYKQVVLTSKK